MVDIADEERRIRIERRRAVMARNAALRAEAEKKKAASADDRFKRTRAQFHRNVAYWNESTGQPPKAQTLRIHRDMLHKRLLWTVNDALDWGRDDDGSFVLDIKAIDALQKPLALLLQFVKAEHKIALDHAVLRLREKQMLARTAKLPTSAKEKNIVESAERPHTPKPSS